MKSSFVVLGVIVFIVLFVGVGLYSTSDSNQVEIDEQDQATSTHENNEGSEDASAEQ